VYPAEEEYLELFTEDELVNHQRTGQYRHWCQANASWLTRPFVISDEYMEKPSEGPGVSYISVDEYHADTTSPLSGGRWLMNEYRAAVRLPPLSYDKLVNWGTVVSTSPVEKLAQLYAIHREVIVKHIMQQDAKACDISLAMVARASTSGVKLTPSDRRNMTALFRSSLAAMPEHLHPGAAAASSVVRTEAAIEGVKTLPQSAPIMAVLRCATVSDGGDPRMSFNLLARQTDCAILVTVSHDFHHVIGSKPLLPHNPVSLCLVDRGYKYTGVNFPVVDTVRDTASGLLYVQLDLTNCVDSHNFDSLVLNPLNISANPRRLLVTGQHVSVVTTGGASSGTISNFGEIGRLGATDEKTLDDTIGRDWRKISLAYHNASVVDQCNNGEGCSGSPVYTTVNGVTTVIGLHEGYDPNQKRNIVVLFGGNAAPLFRHPASTATRSHTRAMSGI